MEPIINITSLERNFSVGTGTVRALKGISFTVHPGEFITIMGTSGSGKSTLLNILGCLDTPSAGEYLLGGTPMRDMEPDARALLRNRKIGFVFQSYNLLPRTTALQNVELPLFYNSGISNEERHNRAVAALEKVGLADRMYHTPNQLSGGQQQRVAIARSLVNDPILILADEATGNLDTRTSYEIMAVFQDLNAQGKTIAFVTHESDIAEFSTRSIYLRDGLITRDVPLQQQSAQEALQSLPQGADHDTMEGAA